MSPKKSDTTDTAETSSEAPTVVAEPEAPPPDPKTVFLTDTGTEVVAHADFHQDMKNGTNLATLRDEHGRPYHHCRDDAEGRWVYRQGHS